MYWTLIETGANQKYIFGTSRQRLQVAASAAVWELGYRWVAEATQGAVAEYNTEHDTDLTVTTEPNEIGDSLAAGNVVHVVEASGKAYLLVPERTIGIGIVRRVTERAITSGSAIDVWGYVAPHPLAGDLSDAATSLREASVQLEAQRYKRTSPLLQNPALPIHQRCHYTGLPATSFVADADGTNRARSELASFLFGTASESRRRMLNMLMHGDASDDVVHKAVVGLRDLSDAFEDARWVGVVHADGNGIGRIFTNLATIATGAEFIEMQARLSRNLELITWEALRRAVLDVAKRAPQNSVLPILVGGDDVIAVVDGDVALDFAVSLSRHFQEVAGEELGEVFAEAFRRIGGHQKPLTPDLVAADDQTAEQLSLAVGLALVKPKHPFHHAVELAEKLTERAKSTTRAEGAVAMIAVYETAVRRFGSLRKDASIDGGCYLAEPLKILGTDIGTVTELHEMMTELNRLSTGIAHSFRDALTAAPSRSEAVSRLNRARTQAGHLGATVGPRVGSVSVDTDLKRRTLYSPTSPTTLITALELLSIAEEPLCLTAGEIAR